MQGVIIAPQPARQRMRVATSLGRILRDRGIDTSEGTTAGKSEAECLAPKRPGVVAETALGQR
jgi:hypothetical protein